MMGNDWRMLSKGVIYFLKDHYGYYHNIQEVKVEARRLGKSLLL